MNYKKQKEVKIDNKSTHLKWFAVIFLILILLLVFRIFWLQFIDGSSLKERAYKQITANRVLSPKRGTIYDSTGKALAVSSEVDTISVNPSLIAVKNDAEATNALKEKVAKALSDIFELDYNEVLVKVTSTNSVETIAKKVDIDKVSKLKQWMSDNKWSSGINIDKDNKRSYPYNNLASNLIGFCGSDNNGLSGIEYYWDETLTGTPGRVTTSIDATQESIPDTDEKYIAPENGSNITLTIDANIQSIAEKYLKQGCIENEASRGGNVIIMDPNTGDILAMATYPAYDLNSPYEPHTDEQKAEWKNLDSQDRTTAMQKMWRNKAISDTYEPGSVFKTITSSAALEEGIVTDIDKQGQFCCTGGIEVAGVRIKCWRYYRPHGSESLRLALMNSCNPVFIGLGQKIGVTKYYEYLRKFGLFNKTGIKLPGEANSIFIKEEKAGPVELATISFGQRFEITPLQMVTAVSSIANKGTYIKPRIVKSIINSETGEKTDMPIETGEQIISKENAEKVLSMMNSVVSEGTGKNAKVEGYQVGGKTGTSEDGVNTGKYVTSFCGVANTDDPEIVLLITLYNPTGEGGHQGGGVAAPVGGKILSEVLPYLDSKTDV